MNGNEIVAVAKRLFFPQKGLIADILERENEYHRNFFGKKFNLRTFSEALANYGESKIGFWAELNLEPHFIPEILMSEDADFPGWKEKPEKSFYLAVHTKRIAEIEIEGERASLVFKHKSHYTLLASSVLIDTGAFPSLDAIRKIGPEPVVRYERFIESNVFPQLFPHMPRSLLSKTAFCNEFFLSGGIGNKKVRGRLCIGGKTGLSSVRWCRNLPLIYARPVFVL